MNTLARRQQRGAVLIIALMLLVVLTLLALSAVQDTSLEEHMAGNMRSENVAFQASEAGLREAETWISELAGKPVANSSGSNGVWLLDTPDSNDTDSEPWWRDRDASWWLSNGTEISDDLAYTASDNLSEKPRYVIEERGVVLGKSLNRGQQQDYNGLDYYQVTARGVDMGGRIEVYLRSSYSRRF
jgi:type IV pilus assembly protein PilX